MRLYSFKYPIDFVKLSNNELKLIHTNVELTSENIPKYQTWRNNIYDIFSKDSSGNITPYTIINKLKLLELVGIDIMTEQEQTAAYNEIKELLFPSAAEENQEGE